MGIRFDTRSAHLVQDNGDAGVGDLPSGFGAGQAAADYMNGFHSHARLFRRFRRGVEPLC